MDRVLCFEEGRVWGLYAGRVKKVPQVGHGFVLEERPKLR